MATSRINTLIQHVRGTLLGRDGAGLTDAELLECFVAGPEDAAFTALVRRHGMLVWGVCQRVLRSHHDAEDAFQATFLVLARKAASIKSPELLANWLYGVAHRTALKAKSVLTQRQRRETQVSNVPETGAMDRELWDDLQPILDQELNRLPDKYRAAIVLCDLEDKPRSEAARALGVPEGTVASRLTRARDMLAKRLARHGLALSSASLAALLPMKTSACVPAAVASATIKAVSLVAARQAANQVSAQVIALTEGVLQAMFISKLMRITMVLLVLGTAGLGGGFLLQHQMAAGQQSAAQDSAGLGRQSDPAKGEAKPVAEDKPKGEPSQNAAGGESPPQKLTEIRKDARTLLQEKRDAARAVLDDQERLITFGKKSLDVEFLDWSKRLLDAEMALANSSKERVAALERHWLLRKRWEDDMAAMVKEKTMPAYSLPQATYFRLEVEIEYLKEKAKMVK